MRTTDSAIIIGLHRVVGQIDRRTAALCAEHGLTTSQFGVLEALWHKGDMTVGEARQAILSSDGTIPVVCKNLEKRGWIERRPGERDRRQTILHLSESGRELIGQVYPENEKIIEEELSVLTDDEKRELVRLLGRLRHREGERPQ